jgi:putative ABC transport system permease protein
MIANYFKIAVRNILRHKAYSIINIAGLSIGMACTILILLWLQHELSYDRYHTNADRIYRVATDINFGSMQGGYAVNNHTSGPIMQRDLPEVEKAVRFHPVWGRTLVEYQDKKYVEENLLFADDSVFDIFTFPLINGDPRTALKKAFSVVISEDMARKYFGEENPVGKIVKMTNAFHPNLGRASNFTVTGLVKNVPGNSHFHFNMLVSFETIYVNNERQRHRWTGDINNYTYILLHENSDPDQLEAKLPALVDKYFEEDLKAIGVRLGLFLQPLTSIHLYSKLIGEMSADGDIAYVYTFAAVALFILFIACINYMNLSTARSASRAKEVGIRKVLGAARGKLIRQYIGESIFYSCVSLILALILVEIFLPFFRSFFEVDLNAGYLTMPVIVISFLILIVFVGFVAGCYPAFFLSAFQPAQVLKGGFKTGPGKIRLRGGLVVFQFAISIALIAGTSITYTQVRYLKNKNLGFTKANIVVLKVLDKSIFGSIASIKEELKGHSGVVSVGTSSHLPGLYARQQVFLPEGFSVEQMQMMEFISIDADFVPTLGMQIIAGRNFTADIFDEKGGILINETAARQFGWDNPVGKQITELSGPHPTKTVVGVIRDFHIRSLHGIIEPIYIENVPESFSYFFVKIRPEKISQTISFLETKWKEVVPAYPFDYWFLDEAFEGQYKAETKLNDHFIVFSLIAIVIACLGLFGLASFTAEQRTKEIGIRKSFGASITGLILLLCREFTKWVLVANIIAWPVAYFAMNHWLHNFAYRINIGLGIFILAALLALVIALLTVGYQAIKAARANPIEALRYE